MPAPKPPSDILVLNERQFALLIALRDALMRTSLSLHDLKFELDQEGRKLAQRDCDSLLQRVRGHARNGQTP